jgi:hypothetical protein
MVAAAKFVEQRADRFRTGLEGMTDKIVSASAAPDAIAVGT